MAKAVRDVYGESLAKYGEENKNVVVLDADLSGSTKSAVFGEKFPDRFFNVGIAEANMTGMAAGFASTGKIPFINSFAAFLITNGLLSIRSVIGYTNLNVKIMGAYGGMSDSYDGPTHHTIEDLSIMRAIPNLTVMVASDNIITDWLTKTAIDTYGPMYIRLTRNAVPDAYAAGTKFEIGRAMQIKDGKDATIITCGVMLSKSLEAAQLLEKDGISVRVVDMFTIKPIDKEMIRKCAQDTGLIVSVEEHNIFGGLGSAIAEVMATENMKVPLEIVGINDTFTLTGDYDSLLKHFGLDADSIAERVKKALQKK